MLRGFFLLLLLLIVGGGIVFWEYSKDQTARQNRYNDYILEASVKYLIDPDLIRAVIWRESKFDERAFGAAQERGLMQVTPTVGKEWAKAQKIETFQPDDLFDPRTNIHAGSWYLSRARSRWTHTDTAEIFALAEYNAGRSHALRWAKDLPNPPSGKDFLQRIDFPTTKAYIQAVMKQYDTYRQTHPQTAPHH